MVFPSFPEGLHFLSRTLHVLAQVIYACCRVLDYGHLITDSQAIFVFLCDWNSPIAFQEFSMLKVVVFVSP